MSNRISCLVCKHREEELAKNKQRAGDIYDVGNNAKPGMGHSYYFISNGRIALCIASAKQKGQDDN